MSSSSASTSDLAAGLIVRRAGAHDAPAVAEVWLRSYAAALPTVRQAHTGDEVRDWIRDVVIACQETWVACVEGQVAALLSLEGSDVDQLYVDPAYQGRGIGSRLLATAQAGRPDGLGLWTFQLNQRAIDFYRAHGFVEIRRTDGVDNEEREPDVRMEWQPAPESSASQ
jgi:ribosomal protein S18 acetylase RimI-like enzyme